MNPGLLYALAAFTIWGLFPLYFRQLAGVAPFEVVLHRSAGSLVTVLLLMAWLRPRGALRGLFSDRRRLGWFVISGWLLAFNWLLYVLAVQWGRLVEASLGFFINPLINVLVGVLVLRERLRPLQWLAVALAASGVVLEVVTVGSLPWIALALAFSFAAYGLLRKLAPAEALAGLFAETALLAPVALAYLLVLAAKGEGTFAADTIRLDLLLVLAGLVTALPLVLFVAGARRVRLVTVGLLQYIAPTGHFLLALFVFGETITLLHGLTFALTWVGLALYTADALRGPLRVRRAAA